MKFFSFSLQKITTHHGNIHQQHFLIQQTILCKIQFEPQTESKKRSKKDFLKQKRFLSGL